MVGPLLFVQPPLTYLAALGCVALDLFLRRTQAGLTLRATGENPEAAFASGAEPLRVRMLAVVAGGGDRGPRRRGAVAAADRHLHRQYDRRARLSRACFAHRGALEPIGAAPACLAFGAAEAFELRLQTFGVPVSSYVVQMAPYLIALAVLAGLGRSSRLPASIGQPLPWER